MSRRSVLVNAVRKNLTKQTVPRIIIIDPHDGKDPIVSWSLNHRTPTPAEIAAALAEYKRKKTTHVEPDTLKPAQGSGDEGDQS